MDLYTVQWILLFKKNRNAENYLVLKKIIYT